MINENLDYGQALTVAAGGFESTGHPHWVIQKKFVDRSGIVPPSWNDAYLFYDEDAVYKDCVPQQGIDYPVKYRPEELRKILIRLRESFPDDEFRMVMRIEMEKDVGF